MQMGVPGLLPELNIRYRFHVNSGANLNELLFKPVFSLLIIFKNRICNH